MAIIRGSVGEQFPIDGGNSPLRQGDGGELIASKMHGRHYEAGMSDGRLFLAGNIANTTITVAAAAASGLILFNPAGSGRVLELLSVSVGLASVPLAVCGLVIAANYDVRQAEPTAATALIVRPAYLGQTGMSAALAFSSGTMATAPVVVRVVGGVSVAASLVHANPIVDRIDGAIVVAPGAAVLLQALGGAVNARASMLWAEWPE